MGFNFEVSTEGGVAQPRVSKRRAAELTVAEEVEGDAGGEGVARAGDVPRPVGRRATANTRPRRGCRPVPRGCWVADLGVQVGKRRFRSGYELVFRAQQLAPTKGSFCPPMVRFSKSNALVKTILLKKISPFVLFCVLVSFTVAVQQLTVERVWQKQHIASILFGVHWHGQHKQEEKQVRRRNYSCITKTKKNFANWRDAPEGRRGGGGRHQFEAGAGSGRGRPPPGNGWGRAAAHLPGEGGEDPEWAYQSPNSISILKKKKRGSVSHAARFTPTPASGFNVC